MTIKINDTSPKKYIILGCHQSGTSFIAKALYDQGIPMGAITKLTYENVDISNKQENLLETAGGGWDNPPTKKEIKKIRQLIRQSVGKIVSNNKKNFAYKDPRTCLLLSEYMDQVCDDDAYLIAVFRKPEKNITSLCRRGMYIDKARRIVNRYNKEILSCIKQFLASF